MKSCPMLLRIDFEREIARLVETDFRFGKTVFAHQEINLIQAMLPHKHFIGILPLILIDRIMAETFLIGAEVNSFEIEAIV